MTRRPRLVTLGALAAGALALGGCSAVVGVALRFLYERQPLPAANVRRDVGYVPGSADPKHRLNLFVPLADSVRARPWPVVVFVHGGGWTTGDRDLRAGGEDIYGNVGRYLARHGIGAAVISYRLVPDVTWPAQIEDVAAAVAWVRANAPALGGDPDGLFLMGHSAGGQLATRVALDTAALARVGVPAAAVCGAIPVSGAALDLTDRPSVAGDWRYLARRFAPPGSDPPRTMPETPFPWQVEASPVRFARPVREGGRGPDLPPFLILYASGEGLALQRQGGLLQRDLLRAGGRAEVVVVPGESHERIVLTLSQDGKTAGPAVIRFVRAQRCGGEEG